MLGENIGLARRPLPIDIDHATKFQHAKSRATCQSSAEGPDLGCRTGAFKTARRQIA